MEIPAEPTAVLGLSGAGKTSLLNVLVGFTRPASGKIAGPAQVAWVPQDHGLWYGHTAVEQLTLAGASSAEAMRLLADLDLDKCARAKPDRLSLGEAARLAVARALAQKAPVLVMDEPLAHVDSARIGKYWRIIREHMARSDSALLFATHQPELALAEATHAICLRDGNVTFQGSIARLYNDPPNMEAATCLGPGNWITRDDAHTWLSQAWEAPRCIRPERLSIEPSPEGRLELTGHRFCGAHAESDLRSSAGALRTFIHRPSHALPVGARVNLRILPDV